MKRALLITLVVALLAALAIGVQEYPKLDDITDPNIVRVDPADPNGRRLLLGFFRIRAGDEKKLTGHIEDPDGDPFTLKRLDTGQQIAVDPNGDWGLSMMFTILGQQPFDVAVTDGIDTREGTFVFEVYGNQAPEIGGCRLE